MSVVMDIFLSLMETLKVLEYPNINTLNNDQIVDIFNNDNRIHLLTWCVKKLYPNIDLPTSTNKLKIYIANIIYENGFCTSSEKNKFVEGSTLDIPSQLKIMRIMLNYLLLIQSEKENISPLNFEKININEIDAFLKQDINLFPAYGPMKVRSSSERQKKIKECEREIQLLKQQIEPLRQEEIINLEYNVNERDIDANMIICLQNNIQQFTDDSNNLLYYKSELKKDNNTFNDGFANITSNCKAQLSNVAKSVECMKVISNFSPIHSVRNTEENEFVDSIKHLAQLSDGLVSSLG